MKFLEKDQQKYVKRGGRLKVSNCKKKVKKKFCRRRRRNGNLHGNRELLQKEVEKIKKELFDLHRMNWNGAYVTDEIE